MIKITPIQDLNKNDKNISMVKTQVGLLKREITDQHKKLKPIHYNTLFNKVKGIRRMVEQMAAGTYDEKRIVDGNKSS